MSLGPIPFPNVLRSVTLQFQAFLADPENAKIVIGDEPELANLLSMIASLDGDFNHHLKYQPQLVVCISWYYNKYNGFLIDMARNCTTQFNLLYTSQRANGWNEWDAKRKAETDKAWLDMSRQQDRLTKLVNIMKSLVDACKDRKPVLEQLANNYRAEVRGEQSTI